MRGKIIIRMCVIKTKLRSAIFYKKVTKTWIKCIPKFFFPDFCFYINN